MRLQRHGYQLVFRDTNTTVGSSGVYSRYQNKSHALRDRMLLQNMYHRSIKVIDLSTNQEITQ